MEMRADPWEDIEPPAIVSKLTAKRVAAEIPWDCFWARNSEGQCILLMEYSSAEKLHTSTLPKLRGAECKHVFDHEESKGIVALTLRDPKLRDVFYTLCLDIVSAVRQAASQTDAVGRMMIRMWRWHHLLRGGGDERLSPEEQKGLIGELFVLDRILLPTIGARSALESWKGPLDGIKDFNIAQMAIEAKARGSAAPHQISIFSEFQLDPEGLDALFLFVAVVDTGLKDSVDGFTITQLADNVRADIEAADAGSTGLFESLLGSSGFRWEDDYSDSIWVHGQDRIYSVGDPFPKIVPAMLRDGVEHVRYSVTLDCCDSHQITREDLTAFLVRIAHAN